MKKFFGGAVVLALTAVACAPLAGTRAAAAVAYPDANYGAYVTATGEIGGGDGLTVYYTKIGDGNGVMTFDLLHANEGGLFGLICGNSEDVGDLNCAERLRVIREGDENHARSRHARFFLRGGADLSGDVRLP